MTAATASTAPASTAGRGSSSGIPAWWHSYPPGCPPPKEFRCRLVDVGGDRERFFDTIRTAAKHRDQQHIMTVPRVEVPPEVLRTATTPALRAADEGTAARHSLMSFQCFMKTTKEQFESNPKTPFLGLQMKYVGLAVHGRPGLYNLLWFAHDGRLFACNDANESEVYELIDDA